MYTVGDLGFSSLVLVVSLVLPVISFVIRRKWRLAVARKEEIKRLLVLAAEEAARAELEASLGYGAAVTVSTGYQQCAVCYSPTPTRCARCKAVRYCSAKCQIIHWRQGHKEECHPPAYSTHLNNDEGSDSCEKLAEGDQHGIHGDRSEIDGRNHTRPTKIYLGEPPLNDATNSNDILHRKDLNVEYHSDRERTDYASETCSSPFSGFSTPPTSVESSDDASVCESISSNEPERSNRPQSADSSPDMLWTGSSVNDMDQSNPLSPKFANLVDSVSKFSKSDQVKPDCGESKHSSIPSDLGINVTCDGQSPQDCTSLSGLGSKTFEANESRDEDGKESVLSNSKGSCSSTLSHSESSFQSCFDMSGNPSLSSPAQCFKVKGIISDDPFPATSLENINLEVHSSSSKCERSYHLETVMSHILKPRDVETSANYSSSIDLSSGSKGASVSARNTSTGGFPSLRSEKSDHAFNDPGRTLHVLNSKEAKCLSTSANAQSSSSVKVESVPSEKSGKVSVVHAISATATQVVSSSGRQGLKTSMMKVVDQFRVPKLPKHYHNASENEAAGRYKDKGLFPYELFVKLYNWNKVALQPCGLINCGNSCYANAVLQCLAFTPPLTAYFLQGLHSKSCVKKEWCFTCEFENLILKAKEEKSVLSPIGILSQLQNIGSQLGNGKQEDAHEFLRYAVDTMQSVCLKEAGVKMTGSSEEETTLIGLTFGGYLRSKIRCMKCRGKSERHERMMDLTVEIEGDIGTLEEALRRFTSTEILDGENKYQCNSCKSYEKAKKKLTILEAPNVLTIALKRFQSGKFGKLNKSIRFPEILNLAPYMSGTSNRSPVYRLFGVVVHLDIMNAAFSGHYVCYVKNIQNKWFKIDDSTVTTAELERVLTKGAYMLLYARCSPRAPRLIRSKMISSGLKSKSKNPSTNSRSFSTHSAPSQCQPSSIPPDVPPSIESFFSKYQRLQRILEEDSSSDNSSLLSNNSDECSCSTDSTRDSTSTDDLSEFIFGDSGRGWNSPRRNSSDSDVSSSSSSSPLYHPRNSSVVNSDCHTWVSPETSRSRADYTYSATEHDNSRLAGVEGNGGGSFFHSDTTKHCRKLGSSIKSSSSYRETNSERLGMGGSFSSGVPLRRSTSERTG
ncbi:hypothetical protein SLE2022_115050 [Rubroshorea leprosula]